jgi:cold shock CspA family protein
MAETGRLLRFDEFRGYGFIVPDKGGEDVFVHANELCGEKELFTAGTTVEYEVTEGERGPKAFAVYVTAPKQPSVPKPSSVPKPPSAPATPPISVAPKVSEEDAELADVLTRAELEHEFTDLVINAVGDVTGAQILLLRQAVVELARRHGWLEDAAQERRPGVPKPIGLTG